MAAPNSTPTTLAGCFAGQRDGVLSSKRPRLATLKRSIPVRNIQDGFGEWFRRSMV